ncbi:nibrin isoform X1 [Sitophilus oryzae]|uniref:Nibrin isoform X1 n=2 Tax=Sitophilus oryzae TaxID=7048 RepID=A0A6J2XEV3_SITOR|nr:nibrin isoform X1 [Sitophilus oryzae]
MTYSLKRISTGEEIALSEGTYIVGRKDCDIVLRDDASISRKHAIIRVKSDGATLEDSESKYHTLHNDTAIQSKTEIKLKNKDLIKFGMLNHVFRFEFYNFVVSASGLSSEKKSALKQNVEYCCGKYVDKWSSECTHLTVEMVTVTVKVLQALIDEKPIVTPDYWSAYKNSKDKGLPPPDINKYNRPEISEQLLKSDFKCEANPKRKTLFRNKVFLFLKTNVKNQIETVVKSCGGECIAWDEQQLTYQEIKASPKEYLIIKPDEDNELFNDLIKVEAKENRRTIPLTEIALAVIYCSCETSCNPNFNKSKEIFGNTSKNVARNAPVIAKNTQTQLVSTMPVTVKSEKIIPATLEDDVDVLMSLRKSQADDGGGIKRPISNANQSVSKKKKVEGAKQKDLDSWFTKPSTSKVDTTLNRSRTNMAEGDSSQVIRVESNKRKAEEPLQSQSKKSNPFTLCKRGTTNKNVVSEKQSQSTSKQVKRNPFAFLSSTDTTNSNTTKAISDNTTISRRALEDMLQQSQTRNEGTTRVDFPLKVPKVERSLVSSLTTSIFNDTWFSKKQTHCKQDKSKIDDPGLQKIVEMFADCVQIKLLPECSFERTTSTINESTVEASGVKNFKKFRKVAPLRPQMNFISRKQLTKVAVGNVRSIQLDNFNRSDDEDVQEVRPTAKPKRKKFVL